MSETEPRGTNLESAFAVVATEAGLVVDDAIGRQLVDQIDGLIARLALLLSARESHFSSALLLRLLPLLLQRSCLALPRSVGCCAATSSPGTSRVGGRVAAQICLARMRRQGLWRGEAMRCCVRP